MNETCQTIASMDETQLSKQWYCHSHQMNECLETKADILNLVLLIHF